MVEATPQVLVVDAERFFREAIRDALASAEIDCEVAESGEAALAAVEKSEFAVVVLDVGLPDMSAVDVLTQLRDRHPSLRVIVVSTHAGHDIVLEALRREACDYLAKPLHAEELVLAVRRALEASAVETSWSSLRRRICSLDAHLADLGERASDCDPRALTAKLGAQVVEMVSEVLEASKVSLMVLGDDGGELRVAAAVGHALSPEEMDPVAPGEGVAGLALAQGDVILSDDVERDERFAGRLAGDRYASTSLAVAPFSVRGSPRGVLCATDRKEGAPFRDADLALLRILALHVGQLFAGGAADPADARREAPPPADSQRDITQPLPYDVPQGSDDAELARMICDALTAEIEPDRVVHAVLSAVSRTLPAAPVALYLIENVSGTLRLEGQVEGAGPADREEFERDAGLTGLVLQTGRLVATDQPDRDPRFDPGVDTPEDGSVRPLLCVPLQMRGKILGVLRAFPSDGTAASARTGEVLAAAVSAAVRNVLLYRSLIESIDDVAKARRGRRSRV